MSDKRQSVPGDELLARREFLRKAGSYSAMAATALLGMTLLSGCKHGGGGGDDWSDYSDYSDSWSNSGWSNSYSDASFYGNAYI